jgi:two-component system OmpR family response regulator
MARVGICEDDPQVRGLLAEVLGGDGHELVLAQRGGEALRLFPGDDRLQAVVLDIGLPDADGRDVCRALRAAGMTAPVLFLTARGGVHEVLAGFGAGGDDYLVKPFAVAELRVRVAALARRPLVGGRPEEGLRLDPARFSVRYEEHEAVLTPTEFRILAALLGRRGDVVRRAQLTAAAWPLGAIVQGNTLDSYIRRLRKRLAEVRAPDRITTVRGVGYAVR